MSGRYVCLCRGVTPPTGRIEAKLKVIDTRRECVFTKHLTNAHSNENNLLLVASCFDEFNFARISGGCRYKVIVHHQGQSAITEFRRLKVLQRLSVGHATTDPEICPTKGKGQEEQEMYSLLEVRFGFFAQKTATTCKCSGKIGIDTILLCVVGEPHKWADPSNPRSYAIDRPRSCWGQEVRISTATVLL